MGLFLALQSPCCAGFVSPIFSRPPRPLTSSVTERGRTQRSSTADDFSSFGGGGGEDINLMNSLRTRIEAQTNQLPLIFRDTLLPRQVHKMTIKQGLMLDLIRDRFKQESPYFGMMGLRQTGGGMTRGVEVELMGYDWNQFKTGITVRLKARRLLELDDKDGAYETNQGWMQSKVRYIDTSKEEGDMMNLAVAMSQAREFTDPNESMNESKSLVDQWLELARTKETSAGQIDQLLNDLGPMPSWNQPSECAFWVGALINPTPALGLAYDIRQPLLMADSAEDRTQIVLDALWNSIQRMDPRPRFEHYGLRRQ